MIDQDIFAGYIGAEPQAKRKQNRYPLQYQRGPARFP
jgi:hypothetical protein